MPIKEIFSILKGERNFNFDLKEEQVKIIDLFVNKKDVFAVLPTGFGKSVCYLLPPLILDKVLYINTILKTYILQTLR